MITPGALLPVISVTLSVLVVTERVWVAGHVESAGLVIPLTFAGVRRGVAAAGVVLAVCHDDLQSVATRISEKSRAVKSSS